MGDVLWGQFLQLIGLASIPMATEQMHLVYFNTTLINYFEKDMTLVAQDQKELKILLWGFVIWD